MTLCPRCMEPISEHEGDSTAFNMQPCVTVLYKRLMRARGLMRDAADVLRGRADHIGPDELAAALEAWFDLSQDDPTHVVDLRDLCVACDGAMSLEQVKAALGGIRLILRRISADGKQSKVEWWDLQWFKPCGAGLAAAQGFNMTAVAPPRPAALQGEVEMLRDCYTKANRDYVKMRELALGLVEQHVGEYGKPTARGPGTFHQQVVDLLGEDGRKLVE